MAQVFNDHSPLYDPAALLEKFYNTSEGSDQVVCMRESCSGRPFRTRNVPAAPSEGYTVVLDAGITGSRCQLLVDQLIYGGYMDKSTRSMLVQVRTAHRWGFGRALSNLRSGLLTMTQVLMVLVLAWTRTLVVSCQFGSNASVQSPAPPTTSAKRLDSRKRIKVCGRFFLYIKPASSKCLKHLTKLCSDCLEWGTDGNIQPRHGFVF